MTPLADEINLSPTQLDADYNARATVSAADFEAEIMRYRQATQSARQNWARALDVIYDSVSGQRLDIYGPEPRPDGAPIPVFVYIHGGYWRALSKDESAMMAALVAREGIATVVVDYQLAPQVRLDEIVRQTRAALAFVWHKGRDYGLDPEQISVGGSSAGGHLVGTVLAAGWHSDFDLPADFIQFAMPISGLFELAPISGSFAQAWLNLDQSQIEDLSPMRHIPETPCPILLAWAEKEPAGFMRQSRAYGAEWARAGGRITEIEVPERNHFDILMDFTDPDSIISRALLAGIRGGARDG
ncbi:alpha/beta hydrolase [Paracoccus sp. (in: a-proteobacteria)]|uniref:alpha/beta hydrolase n=1 Tax=Paracoccus sp. TaxID=267 RepID=UPI002896F551|nr:alpha/beta hydrolase [Paracoccus sp. (in: a-proteobacteria)]